MNERAASLRQDILALTLAYHQEAFPPAIFNPGQTAVPVSGKVIYPADLCSVVDAALDCWFTTGRFAKAFEKKLAQYIGVRGCSLVNSGSSANLLALTALTSPEVGDRRLQPGDEVITVAAGFPTTVNPIVQNGLIPVFVDVALPTIEIDVLQLHAALSTKTRAIMIAHTLGNTFNVDAVVAFAHQHKLWLIEDCCDALGSTYRGRKVGTFGDLATFSFYPAHHITMGEGGAVLTDNPLLKTLVESYRDWGRDCWCEPGIDNTCGKRFNWELGTLPCGYDHKYTYSHIGYNLKATDMQAALGLSQLEHLEVFIQARRDNFAYLRSALDIYNNVLELPDPTAGSEPSWFGFPFGVRPAAPFHRDQLIHALEAQKIATRLVFAGNLLRQPAYQHIDSRQVGSLPNTDAVMRNFLWLGIYPGLTRPMLDHVINTVSKFIEGSQ